MTFPFPMFVPMTSAPTLSFNKSSSNPIAAQVRAATVTFSSVDIGNPADKSDRIVIVTALLQANAAVALLDITGCTIGGVAATELANASHVGGGNERALVRIYAALVTAGTTASVALTIANPTTGGGTQRVGIAAYWVKGIGTAASAIEYAPEISTTNTDPLTGTINVQNGGAVVAGAVIGTTNTSFTWTGATEDLDTAAGVGTLSAAAIGSLTAETGRTVTADQATSGTYRAMAAISIKGSA